MSYPALEQGASLVETLKTGFEKNSFAPGQAVWYEDDELVLQLVQFRLQGLVASAYFLRNSLFEPETLTLQLLSPCCGRYFIRALEGVFCNKCKRKFYLDSIQGLGIWYTDDTKKPLAPIEMLASYLAGLHSLSALDSIVQAGEWWAEWQATIEEYLPRALRQDFYESLALAKHRSLQRQEEHEAYLNESVF